MRKIILRCELAVGDIVMLTAAVRDLHRAHPGQFLVDVRTCWPDLWQHNPYLTPSAEADPEVETIACRYPLIDRCDRAPYHCLHGFIEFLNDRLDLKIKPTEFKGDIHLSPLEKSWYSQVHEVARRDIPFWIVAAGGKYDLNIKWWDTRRFQAVVNHFRGRIQFVQVGQSGHHHPRLDGVIDFRGRTTLRELIRLVYHAQGILCPVTALMHLAAAVETRPGHRANRACVVVAGAREPAHWEAYPGHQFIHVNDALPCGARGGCWKDRAVRLRDGDRRDRPESLCVDVVAGLPRCMQLISPAEVIRRINLYFEGGALNPLTSAQAKAAERAVRATRNNTFDQEPLNLHSAGIRCDRFVESIPACPKSFRGRGIVICGGGVRYFTNAWVCIHMLRRSGCALPIQLWHLGQAEVDQTMASLLTPLGVECVDALLLRRKYPARQLRGWELKAYALLHSPFREVLLLDADNVPVANPEYLFDTPEFRANGAIFWPDYTNPKSRKAAPIWRSCGVRRPHEPEFETGQIVVDRERCWRALALAWWFNDNSDFYYQYLHGDKETFHLAFRVLRQRYSLVPHPIRTLAGTMCQHDFLGRRLFQHRNSDKWDLLLCNRGVKGFWFESECRGYLHQLRRVWDGGLSRLARNGKSATTRRGSPPLRVKAVMISCAERDEIRRQTLADLAETDWGDWPLLVQMDHSTGTDYRKRQTRCAQLALEAALKHSADYLLFLEDDLAFNRHLRHNLGAWNLLNARHAALAGLYNPRLSETACDIKNRARLVRPGIVFGSQALLISKPALRHIVDRWESCRGMQDIRISRLAGQLGEPVYYHAPSLVQHVGRFSVWGGHFHQAADFDPEWRAGTGG